MNALAFVLATAIATPASDTRSTPATAASDAAGANPSGILEAASGPVLQTELVALGGLTPTIAVEMSPQGLTGASVKPGCILSRLTVSFASHDSEEIAQAMKLVLLEGSEPSTIGDGFAVALATKESMAGDRATLDRAYVFLTGSKGFGFDGEKANWGEIVVTGRYFRDVGAKVDDVLFGMRVRAFVKNASVYVDTSMESRDGNNGAIVALGVDGKVRPGTWLTAGVGGRIGADELGPDVFTSVGLRYAFGQQ